MSDIPPAVASWRDQFDAPARLEWKANRPTMHTKLKAFSRLSPEAGRNYFTAAGYKDDACASD
jgi:hypothetical protein